MKSIRPLDTSPEAYNIQIEIFSQMTPEQRLKKGFELSEFCRKLHFAGVKYRHPDYTDEEIHLAVGRLELGEEIFLRVYPHAAYIEP